MSRRVLSITICFLLLITTIFICPEITAAQKLASQSGLELPKGFPGEIPFPDDAFIVEGKRNESSKAISVSYKSDKKASDISSMYKDYIKKYTSSFKENIDSATAMYTSSFNGYDIQLVIIKSSPAMIAINLVFQGDLPNEPVYKAAPVESKTDNPISTNQSRLKLPSFIPKDIPFTRDAVLSNTKDNSFAPAGKQNMVITYKTKLAYNDVVSFYKPFARNGSKENSELNQGSTYFFGSNFVDYGLQIYIENGLVKLIITPVNGVFRNHYDKTDYSSGVIDKSGVSNPNLQTPKRLMTGSRMTAPYSTNIFVKKNNNNLFGRAKELYIDAKQDQSGQWDNEIADSKWTLINDNAYCLDTEGNNYFILKPDSSLWTYGVNGNYLLGNGGVVDSSDYPPTKILDSVRTADIGSNGTAVKKDGSLWIWGKPSPLFSVLDKPGEGRLKPEKVMDNVVDAVQSGSTDNIGNSIIMILKTDGSLWTWGKGNCGDGGLTFEREKPIKVMNGVKAIEASFGLCSVIKKDNSLWIWQSHETKYSSVPNLSKPIKILNGVKMVSPGLNFLVALKTDGSVWTYGSNSNGECGIGNLATKYLSVPRKILSGVSEISATENNAFALMNTGKIMGWGMDVQFADGYDWLKLSNENNYKVAKPTDIGYSAN